MAIDITNKNEKKIALTGAEIEETLLQAHLSKDAIEKIEGLEASASEIDNMVTNGATQADLDAVVLDSGNITPEQSDIINGLGYFKQPSINLFDSSLVENNYVFGGTGIKTPYVGGSISGKIEISPSSYYITNSSVYKHVFFDSSNIYISTSINPAKSFMPPATAKYMYLQFSGANLDLSSFQLEQGEVSTSYKPFYAKRLKSEIIYKLDEKVNSIATDAKFTKFTVLKNLYNKSTDTSDVYLNFTGGFKSNVLYRTSDYIAVTPLANYVSNKTIGVSNYYDENKNYIQSNVSNIANFSIPSNARYIRFSAGKSILDDNFQFEKGTIATKYEPYKEAYTINNLDISNDPTIITASFSDITANFVGRRAIQDAIDSITDASPDNRYSIVVSDGVYTATSPSECDKVGGSMKAFISGKSHVDIVLSKDTYIICKLPNNLGSSFQYSEYQTVLWHADDAYIYGGNIIAENCRYPIHIDSPILNKDTAQFIKGCNIIHNGNTGDATNWTSTNPIGIGTGSGQEILIENSIVAMASTHNNGGFQFPSIVTYKNCSILGGYTYAIVASSFRSTQRDKLVFEQCDIAKGSSVGITTGSYYTNLSSQKADRIEVEIEARDNQPLAIDNSNVNGIGLMITSKSIGSNSSVSFDNASSAFPLIISTGLNSVPYSNRYLRKVVFGYEKFIGGNGLASYAIGSLDISENAISSNYITSLGKRLGDCSTVNKTLTVIIDGTSYNIVFNKNYNGTASTAPSTYTNAQIIAEITAVIGSVATVKEYVVGKDYYPLFKGNTVKTNADTSEILKGMGIVFNGVRTIRKATNSDGRIDGIALDDCIVGGTTRIITCGQIYTRNSGQRFAIQQNANTATTYGTKLGMSATAGIFEINATPMLLLGTGANIVEII